jgi:hypothetical protein
MSLYDVMAVDLPEGELDGLRVARFTRSRTTERTDEMEA